jgi:phthalate 4,5-dioxygenase reductase subunit
MRPAPNEENMSANEAAAEMMTLRIARREKIADDIYLFELADPAGADLPEFSAGAHLAFIVPNGATRKYSLVNDPTERHRYQIAVKREAGGRGGSISLVDDTKPGNALFCVPPQNDFPLAANVSDFIFIAGGIGITPIMSMVRHLKAVGTARFKLYYVTRNRAGTAFADELGAPELRHRVTIHHDDGDPENFFDLWPVLERPSGAHIYCCGPRPLMQSVNDMTGHWPVSRVHFEDFGTAAKTRPDDKPFRVRLARSGEVLDVPVGATILEVLRAHGLIVPSSCESGTCGSCRTRLAAGQADHRDLVLGEEERADNIMVCVSRALTPEIIIDR